MTRLAVLLLVATVAAAGPPATHQIKLDGQTFTLPVGFTIEKVAGPPLVDRPVSASFDDRGRLYVTDSSGSNEKLTEQIKHPNHRVIRLEDTKGTGVFDKATVFADKMMFPEGILWHRGQVYVSAVPQIWKLTDTDDDGVADKREVWFDGKTMTGCGNDLHGPYLGPDGWIYWCKGAFAKQEYTLPNGKKFTTRASHIFRARPDGTGIEPVMTGGMDNPVGVAFLPNGERFFTCTFLQHPAAGKRDGIIHAVYGGIWGKDHDVIYDPDHKWTSPNTMPVMTHLGPAAPCGLCCYQSDAFGKEYTSNLFACQFNMHKVSRHVLKPSGSTYTTEDSDFVVSDSTDFHPTDVQEDADGSLIVVNTGGWYKLCCPSSQLVKADVLGAIYRVRKEGAPKIEDARGTKIDWKKLSHEEVAKRLADPRPVVQRLAADELVRRGPAASSWIVDLLDEGPAAARRALWVWARIDDKVAREWVREAAERSDEDVRITACQCASATRNPLAVGVLRDRLSEASHSANAKSETSIRVRRAAAEALGRLGDPRAVDALLKALDLPGADRMLEHSITYALIEIGDVKELSVGLESKSPRVRRACLAALDQLGEKLDPKVVLEAMKSKDAALKETALWIAGRHPEWAVQIAKIAHEGLSLELVPVLAKFARTSAVGKVLLGILSDTDREKSHYPKLYALAALQRAGGKDLPSEWAIAIAKALRSGGGFFDVYGAAVAALRALPPAKPGETELANALRFYIETKDLLPERRLEAMSVYPGGMRDMTPDEFDLIVTCLDHEQTAERRGLAAEVLSKAKLTREQVDTLITKLPTVGPLDLDRVLAAFAQTKDDAVGQALLAALNNPGLRSSLRADQVKERIKHFGPSVQKDAEKLYAALNAEYEQQRAKLEEVAKNLKPGDIRRGQAVFNSTKTSCIACHTIGYVGGKIGPDLTRIGSIRQERDLLESILFPSASFVRSYEPLTVRTKDGKVYNGVPKKDAPDEIVLILAADKEQRIAREDVDEVQPGKVSIMPAGLDKQLNEQELADLIAFLKACK